MPTEKQYFCYLVVSWRQPSHAHTGAEMPMSAFFIRHDENTYAYVFHLAWKNCRNEVVSTIPVFKTILSDPHLHKYSVQIQTLSQRSKAWVRTGNCFWLHHELPLLQMMAVGCTVQDFSLQTHNRAAQHKNSHMESWEKALGCFPHLHAFPQKQ